MLLKNMTDNKYINKNVSEDSEKYFDFQKYCNDFKKKHYKRVVALIPRSDEEMIQHLATKDSVSAYIYGLIKDDIERNKK